MRGRVYLIAGEMVDKAGPILFDPPVSVGQTGFYDVVIGGEGPVLERVERALQSPIAELEAKLAESESRIPDPSVVAEHILGGAYDAAQLQSLVDAIHQQARFVINWPGDG